MAQKVVQGNKTLAKQIRDRRNELGLTIEEAASRAGVGTKTWCRYEAGESIRRDKCKGICKALNWKSLQTQESEDEGIAIQEYMDHIAWSPFLAEMFGDLAAMSFAVGSDILLDHITDDLEELACMPRGTHIGQLDVSWIQEYLPKQFLMCYTYEFLYQMRCVLSELRLRANVGLDLIAHSVLEELIIYLCSEEAAVLLELSGEVYAKKDCDFTDIKEWVFDLFDDMDLITYLYSDRYLAEDHPYHFSSWGKAQFYAD